MRYSLAALAVVSLSLRESSAFNHYQPLNQQSYRIGVVSSRVGVTAPSQDVATDLVTEDDNVVTVEDLDWKDISNLSYRDLQKHIKARELSVVGTTAVLRERLHLACGGECVVDEAYDKLVGDCSEDDKVAFEMKGVEFTDVSDPDFDFKALSQEIIDKSEMNHWKSATRKLKKLKKKYETPERTISEEVYVAALDACMDSRLSGARAAIPARRIMEDMIDTGYSIPSDKVNYCILNSLGDGPDGTHDGFGGIDCALAMTAVAEQQESKSGISVISEETYARVATVLSNVGEIDESTALLKKMIAEKSFTPTLGVFADVAISAAKFDPPKVMNVLALCKASGYELDNIASTIDGRSLLAAGVVAAESMDNSALGLRLLAAAQKATGCEPDRGDDLVCSSSSTAQRAAMLIHKKSIRKAIEEGEWRLAVRLMERMMERSLKPSPAVWKSVVTCCGKSQKSRRATALLLDWVKLSEAGELATPPLEIFNTVLNACEICDEQDLTLLVLESMKKTHETDGTIITFNIALKRLARLGNVSGCEGIIIGMLQQGIEPSVVSYTTAIAACAVEGKKNPEYAYEWVKRMRSRNVRPNLVSYNTALAACLDGKLESSALASKIASEMLVDINQQVQEGKKRDTFTNVIPDNFTKRLCKQLVKQLRDNWRNGDIDMRVAKATIRGPLLQLLDFDFLKSVDEAAKKAFAENVGDNVDEAEEAETDAATERDELELEYSTVISNHRTAEV